ncbi:MAG: hypothetical protein JXX14_26275, partial [Deltaproteobacteria bacterium]|nr:hypothetical protein [Deltaproteobacteria bacterium]
MKKLTVIPWVALVFWAQMSQAQAGCEHDNDCKGTRICENGACVYPPADASDAPSTAPPPLSPASPSSPASPPNPVVQENPAAAPIAPIAPPEAAGSDPIPATESSPQVATD